VSLFRAPTPRSGQIDTHTFSVCIFPTASSGQGSPVGL